MRQNQSMTHQQETSTIHQIRSGQMQDFMTAFPYQFYSPYWNYPFYNYPFDGTEKFGFERCKHCRIVSTATVTTQTSQNLEEDQQLVDNVQKFKINNALQEEIIPHFLDIKLEEKYDEVIDFQQINSLPDPSISTPDKKQKEILSNQDATHPLKEDLFQLMLNKYLIHPEEYETLIEEYLKDDTLYSQVIKYFHEKITSFKKSKQEMIKLIIRKTQRHYKLENNCKKDQRFKKFGGFKSMNTIYLEKLFSDPAFARSYNIVFETFVEDFEKESSEKLKVFLEKIYSADSVVDFKSAIKLLDEKNRMPWPAFWVDKLRRVACEIKTNYVNENVINNAYVKKKGGLR